MADLIPPMLIQLQADVTQLKAGLAQAESALKGVDDSVKTASTGMTDFMGKMKQVGATMGVAFAGQQVVQFAKDVVMASSNMAESLSKVDVVFGANAEAIKSWSDTSATAMGMSKQAALEAAGTYGNLFQAFGLGQGPATEMSTTLVQLASDMASFNNTSIDDAILALRSGLSGETEPLKKFGVALSEARLKDEALAMGLIKSTKEALTPAAKAQASYALIMKDTKLAQGDYGRTADGTANTMRTLSAQFANAKVALGDALMPAFTALLGVLKLVIPVLTAIGKFFKENSDALKMYATVLGLAAAAFYTYRAAIIVTKATQQAFLIMQGLMRGATLASMASTNGLAASILVLNAAMRANPIGLIITALTLVGAAFVIAWKKSETFRGIVIKVVQVVMNGFAKLVEIAGKFFNLLGKVPGMGWAKSVGKGLDGISDKIKSTSKNLSDLKSNFKGMGNVSMSASGAGVSSKTGGGGKGGGGGGGGGGADDSATAKALAAAKEKAKKLKETLNEYKKDVKDIYADINEAVADAQEKADEELIQRNESMLKAHTAYDEKVLDLKKNYNEALLEADKNYNDTVSELQYRYNDTKEKAEKRYGDTVTELQYQFNDKKEKAEKRYSDTVLELQYKFNDTKEKAEKRYNDTVYEAEKRYKERLLDIEKAYAEKKADLTKKNQDTIEKATKAYNDKVKDLNLKYEDAVNKATETAAKKKLDIEKDYNDKILDLRKNLENKLSSLQEAASNKSADLIKSAADKQLNIVQQSMDRLRNAFASKTGFDLGEALAGGSPEQALDKLKKSLEAAKTLQANAAALAGMGYSQVFIEEVIKNGPEAGNKIAEGLKNASPEATKELQALYTEVENISNHGLDALATTMNQGGKLATEELTNAYKAVSTDLTTALSEVQQTLNENLAEANASYADAMAEAKTNRDEKLAEAQSTLLEALGSAKKALDDDLADVLTTLNEAKEEANKTLREGLAEAEKNYLEDLAKAKATLDDAIADAKKTLSDAMAEAQKDLDKSLADAAKALKDTMEESQKDLDKSIADAKKALIDTMAEAQKDLDKGLADAAKALKEAREKALKDLEEGLADAAKTLQDALIEAQKDYDKAIDEINKSTDKKLADLKKKLAEISALMAKLGTEAGSKAAVSAIENVPVYTPIIPNLTPGGSGTNLTSGNNNTQLNLTQNFTNAVVDPAQVAEATVSGIKYGNAVIIANPGLSVALTNKLKAMGVPD